MLVYDAIVKGLEGLGVRAACLRRGWRPRRDAARIRGAFKAALASDRPTLIDAAITRLALPHYSPSPAGIPAALWERLRERFGRD